MLCTVGFSGLIKSPDDRENNSVSFVEGFSLSGGHDSLHQVVYISDIDPRSSAAVEGNLQLLDVIHYVNGISTQGLTLEEANRALGTSLPSVVLKATRYSAVVHGRCVCVCTCSGL